MNSTDAARWLSERDNFLIISHRRPDGDAIGSAAGLAQGLRECGKTAYVFNDPETIERYVPYVEKYIAPDGFVPEHIITVDTAAADLLPPTGNMYKDSISLAIDHHPSYTGYASQSCVDSSCAACGELVYAILMELSGEISTDTAIPLYIALASDTGCFSFGNTTADTLRIASVLVEAGAPNNKINKTLFNTKTRNRIMLEGLIMAGLEFHYNDTVAIASITQEMIDQCGATENIMTDLPAISFSIENIIAGITIRELSESLCKISVRTASPINASDFCAKFGGGGHPFAAGCEIELPIKEAKAQLVAALADKLGA